MIVVCTLFEGNYHFGLATLLNSLETAGFTGTVVAGYRGSLPLWASGAKPLSSVGSGARASLAVSRNIEVQFWSLDTQAHFTNIKPHFMQQVLRDGVIDAEAILYLDPDVVLVSSWSFVEDWMSCGVALCEDVNSPLMIDHPRRIGWRRHFGEKGIELNYRFVEYVNGGCVGVQNRDLSFLEMWERCCDEVSNATGGPATAKVEGGAQFASSGFADCFSATDQDALNAAIEAHGSTVFSVLPRSAMGFDPGQLVLPHAVGRRKPWQRRYFVESLRGRPPRAVDRAYWEHAVGPAINAHSFAAQVRARVGLKCGAAIGRLWSRR